MKKIGIVLFFSLVFSLFAQAQNSFRFGIQASPTWSWFNTDNNKINGNGANMGFKLGLLGEYDFAENYSFIGGVNFAFNHGGTLKYDKEGKYWPSVIDQNLPEGVNLKYNLQLVEIPFGLKMRTNEFGLLRYYAELPVFTFGFVTKTTGDIKGVDAAFQREKENIKKEVKGFSMSWGVGAGVEYDISSSTKLVGGIYYQKYFFDLTEKTDADDSKASMNGLALKIGILF